MKRRVVLTSLCIIWFFSLSWHSPLCAQEASGKTKSKPKTIEGVWTEIYKETEGEIISMLPDLTPRLNGPITGHYLWKITNEIIEMGPDRKKEFPLYRHAYKLNPRDQDGAIDLLPLDEDKDKKKGLAIYFVKDDYLIICIGRDARPKSFTSSKENPTTIHVLRRGKLNNRNMIQDSSSPKRKDK